MGEIYREKDYTGWMKLKTKINNEATSQNLIQYHEGEIYWVSLGENVGREQDGKNQLYSRPVVIVRGFSASLVLVAPLSTAHKSGPYYFPFKHRGETSVAVLSQLRALDLVRVCKDGYYGRITRKTLVNLKKACAEMIYQPPKEQDSAT